MKFPKLIAIKILEKYRLHLKYEDGTEGVLDLSESAGKGVFKFWDEENNFFNASIDPVTGAIAWGSKVDVCPHSAYLNLIGLSFDEWKRINHPHAADF